MLAPLSIASPTTCASFSPIAMSVMSRSSSRKQLGEALHDDHAGQAAEDLLLGDSVRVRVVPEGAARVILGDRERVGELLAGLDRQEDVVAVVARRHVHAVEVDVGVRVELVVERECDRVAGVHDERRPDDAVVVRASLHLGARDVDAAVARDEVEREDAVLRLLAGRFRERLIRFRGCQRGRAVAGAAPRTRTRARVVVASARGEDQDGDQAHTCHAAGHGAPPPARKPSPFRISYARASRAATPCRLTHRVTYRRGVRPNGKSRPSRPIFSISPRCVLGGRCRVVHDSTHRARVPARGAVERG